MVEERKVHPVFGQTSAWDKVISNLAIEQEKEERLKNVDNPSWAKAVSNIVESENSVEAMQLRKEGKERIDKGEEPSKDFEKLTIQTELVKAVENSRLSAEQALEMRSVLERMRSQFTGPQGKTISQEDISRLFGELESSMTGIVESYQEEKANKVLWTERINEFQMKLDQSVDRFKIGVKNSIQTVKDAPANTKLFIQNKAIDTLVEVNNRMQEILVKGDEKLNETKKSINPEELKQDVSEEKPEVIPPDPAPAVETEGVIKEEEKSDVREKQPAAKEKSPTQSGTEHLAGLVAERKLKDEKAFYKAYEDYKTNYKNHILTNFKAERNVGLTVKPPDFSAIKLVDQKIAKTGKLDLSIQLRLEAIAELKGEIKDKPLKNRTEKVDLKRFVEDLDDKLSYASRHLDNLGRAEVLTEDIRTSFHERENPKEVVKDLKNDLKDLEKTEAEIEKVNNGDQKPGTKNHTSFLDAHAKKMMTLQQYEELSGETYLTEREAKFSLYAAYHNYKADITPVNGKPDYSELSAFLEASSEDLKQLDKENGTSYYKEIYFEHDYLENDMNSATKSFEEIYEESYKEPKQEKVAVVVDDVKEAMLTEEPAEVEEELEH